MTKLRTFAARVWPRMEAQGACILRRRRTAAATDPQEVVLLTGYHGPGHWEETRGNLPMPEGFDKGLWEQGERLGARRNQLTLKSWSCSFAPSSRTESGPSGVMKNSGICPSTGSG
jgi:hypothetical protein